MLGIIQILRRILEGSISAILIIAIVALMGGSETISLLISEPSMSSLLFLLVLAIVLADLIAKIYGILELTFPDLIPKIDETDLQRASLIKRLRPGQTVALLSGAYLARIILFLIVFALLGTSYASVSAEVQNTLFGQMSTSEAITIFIQEGIAGSLGYFLFFLGPSYLGPIKDAIVSSPLMSSTLDGDIFLSGIRLYGLAFVFALLRVIVMPITYLRARLRANQLTEVTETPADELTSRRGSRLPE